MLRILFIGKQFETPDMHAGQQSDRFAGIDGRDKECRKMQG
jgi:hypothetical protein